MPDRKRLIQKIKSIHQRIRKLRKVSDTERLLHEINNINSAIRGLINYHEETTWVHVVMTRFSERLKWAGYNSLKQYGGKWVRAKDTNNWTSVHERYDTMIPAIEYNGLTVGITNLAFSKWKIPRLKIPDETPYSERGREIHRRRTGKKPVKARADELLTVSLSELIGFKLTGRRYNFEYFLNKAYAFNRDKGKCRVCRNELYIWNTQTHHINPILPMNEINRVPNLASVHQICHKRIHDKEDYSILGKKIWDKIRSFREKLGDFTSTE